MTGLLTFHWADDYGAMLQAYALKHSLETLGASVELVPYAPLRLTGRYWWCPLCSVRLPDGQIKYWFNRPAWRRNLSLGLGFWKRKQAMRAFRRTYLSAQPPIRDAQKLSLAKYSLTVVGSDQVWNPSITVTLDDAYIGNMGDRGQGRLISYAASLGSSSLPEQDQAKFARCVGEAFSAVSVRERSGADFLEALLHRKVEDVADPVLLLPREAWERLVHLPPKKDYILMHCTERNEDMLRSAQALSRLLGAPVIQTSLLGWGAGQVELRAEGGPAEFLGYIQNAACVLTNSFHGAAFSALLEKPFLVFRHSAYNARLEGLLEKLGLTGRAVETAVPPERMLEEINWQSVRVRLEQERDRSLAFLRKNLKG